MLNLFGKVALGDEYGPIGVVTSQDRTGFCHGATFNGELWHGPFPKVISNSIDQYIISRFLSIKRMTELLNQKLQSGQLDVKSEHGRESTRLLVNVLNEAFGHVGRINGLINEQDEWVEFTHTLNPEFAGEDI